MIPPQPAHLTLPSTRVSFEPDRRRRPTSRAQAHPGAPLVKSNGEQLHATWATERGCFELVLSRHSTGVSLLLRTWLCGGPVVEERFLLHTLASLEAWLATAPVKFDHPLAHEEIKRFGHGSLVR